MKANQITFVSANFATAKDYQLQKAIVEVWKKEFSISGLTKYIVRNFDTVKELKELLLRKGYKKSDFGTVNEPNFSFVLSHMGDKAKFHQTRESNPDLTEGAKKYLYSFTEVNGAKVAKVTYQLGTVLNELRKIENNAA